MKNVQISQDLFCDLILYHLYNNPSAEEAIRRELSRKLDAMICHERLLTKNISPVLDYKKQERSKEVAALETQIGALQEQTANAETMLSEKQERLDDIAPILKNTEKFVRKYDDPERLLPEAGMLESGKAFREKKALPILGKLLKYARSLFRENTELKAKVQKLEKENTAFKSANWNHANEIVKLKMENRELKKDKGKLDALVGRIGNDVLQKALEGISKEHSKSQKDNKDEMR